MAKVVKKLVLSPFMLRKAIGHTLHASELKFKVSFNFSWAAASPDDPQYISLPSGVTLIGGAVTAWKIYNYVLDGDITTTTTWNHIGLSEDEYNKKKEEEAKAEAEANKPSGGGAPTVPSIPGTDDEDLYIDVNDIYSFDPDFIKLPSYEIKPPDMSPDEL